MSRGEQRTGSLFSNAKVAGNSKKTFSLRQGLKGAAIQVNIAECCVSAKAFLDEDVSLGADTITEPCHGYATGLKGALSVQIGCAKLTPAACFSTACNIITEAAHCFTTGERGRFTTSVTLPSFCCCVISACTDFFIIDLTACTYNVATTRALAIAGCGVCITAAGAGNQTFTPNGAIPTGLCTCAASSFIIQVDACTYKIASSKVNAEAGTAIDITALQSPASVTFTKAAADCTSGTVTVRYSVDCVNYCVDACAGLLDTPGVILAAGLTAIDNADGLHYNSIEVEVDVTDSQWSVNIDASGKV